MEKEVVQNGKKNLAFYLKKYSNYILLAGVLLTILVAIIVTTVVEAQKITPTESTTVISFQAPVMNGTICKGYSDTELQFNKALGVWQVHKAIDYEAEVGTKVLCAYDGTVTNIKTDLLSGTCIEIDHGNGLKTTYSSLDQKTAVKIGDAVKKGDIIGSASNTATAEATDSGEVHFEVWKDGARVDPSNYLDVSESK